MGRHRLVPVPLHLGSTACGREACGGAGGCTGVVAYEGCARRPSSNPHPTAGSPIRHTPAFLHLAGSPPVNTGDSASAARRSTQVLARHAAVTPTRSSHLCGYKFILINHLAIYPFLCWDCIYTLSTLVDSYIY